MAAKGAGMFEREQAGSDEADAAGKGVKRGGDPGLRRPHAGERDERSDARRVDAWDLDTAVCGSAAGDGLDLRRVEVEAKPGREGPQADEEVKELLERRFRRSGSAGATALT